jgi:hypothetical protein
MQERVAASAASHARLDFDGDGKTDPAVMRLVGGTRAWYIRRSSDDGLSVTFWGFAPSPGDGRADLSAYRHPGSLIDPNWWFVQRNSDDVLTGVQWGRYDDFVYDVPIPGDYDGDGRADCAVVRSEPVEQAAIYILQSTAGVAVIPYSPFSAVVPGDYDGDGRQDIATVANQGGQFVWNVRLMATGTISTFSWGQTGDRLIVGDFDGDGRADAAVWRPGAQSVFYIRRSTDGAMTVIQWGTSTDTPVDRTSPF